MSAISSSVLIDFMFAHSFCGGQCGRQQEIGGLGDNNLPLKVKPTNARPLAIILAFATLQAH